MSKSYEERRRYKINGWEYLLDDDDHTAWIQDGIIGKKRIYTLPTTLTVDGVPYVIQSVELGAFYQENYIEKLIVPDCYIYIDSEAFHDCNRLKSVVIGKGPEQYCHWSFTGCPLEEVVIDPANPYIKLSDDGKMVLSKDGKHLYYYLYDKDEELVVPDTVESIGSCAISCLYNLRRLVLPKNLKTIHPDGIMECTDLSIIIRQ